LLTLFASDTLGAESSVANVITPGRNRSFVVVNRIVALVAPLARMPSALRTSLSKPIVCV
jgi:hypothetical protein